MSDAEPLILDDWGLKPLDDQARHDLLEILEDRYGRRSTIITSQLPVSAWHDVIGNPTYAEAILDRLVHKAHRIDLTGESLRRKQPQKLDRRRLRNDNNQHQRSLSPRGDIDPLAWLADVLARIADTPQSRLDALLPWEWKKPNLRAAA